MRARTCPKSTASPRRHIYGSGRVKLKAGGYASGSFEACYLCGHVKDLELTNKRKRIFLDVPHPKYGSKVPHWKAAKVTA